MTLIFYVLTIFSCVKTQVQDSIPFAPQPTPTDQIDSKRKALAEQSRFEMGLIRGHTPMKADIEFIDLKEMEKEIKIAFERTMTLSDLSLQMQVLHAFAILPPAIDKPQELFQLYAMGALAIYDPWTKRLLIKNNANWNDLSLTLPHEWVHALQDQRFNLKNYTAVSRISPKRGLADKDRARSFLIEGEASAAAALLIGKQTGKKQEPSRSALFQMNRNTDPMSVFLRLISMPYSEGAHTVHEAVKRKGWALIDDLMANLPDSTEQMLHVDKLLERETFKRFEFNEQNLDSEWNLLHADSLGEATILAMLGDVLPEIKARNAAAGWNGDRYGFIAAPNQATSILAVTAWDTRKDAVEFEEGMKRYFQERISQTTTIYRQEKSVWFTIGDAPKRHQSLLRSRKDKNMPTPIDSNR